MEFPDVFSYQEFRRSVIAKASPVTDLVLGGHEEEVRSFLRAVVESSVARVRVLNEPLFRAQRAYGVAEVPIEDPSTGRVVATEICQTACSLNRMLPNPALVGDGRANRRGVPVLYLATTPETAAAEMRPWVGELVTVAAFKLRNECRVVDCSQNVVESFWNEKINYGAGEEPKYNAQEKEKAVWGDIGNAFSAPVAREDPSIEYLPTQVLAEAFRNHGYDGIMYKSLLAKGGENIVLFDLEAARPAKACLYETRMVSWSLAKKDYDQQTFPDQIEPRYKLLDPLSG